MKFFSKQEEQEGYDVKHKCVQKNLKIFLNKIHVYSTKL